MTLPQQGLDIVLVSRRGSEAVQNVMLDTQRNPLFWLKSNFTVVFDEMPDEVTKLENWYQSIVESVPLPKLTIINVNGKRGELNYLRQQGIEKGSLPFVYFQDDDDSLPLNLEIVLQILNENNELNAVFGVTELINQHYQIVESFPSITHEGQFKIDPIEAARWFPTYPHPSAGVFRRSTFENFPYYTGQLYRVCGNGAFLMQLLYMGGNIEFIPYIIRRGLLHKTNMTPQIINEEMRNALAIDIENWQQYISSHEVKMFQGKIIDRLRDREITSYKEIDGMVEERMEKIIRGDSPAALS